MFFQCCPMSPPKLFHLYSNYVWCLCCAPGAPNQWSSVFLPHSALAWIQSSSACIFECGTPSWACCKIVILLSITWSKHHKLTDTEKDGGMSTEPSGLHWGTLEYYCTANQGIKLVRWPHNMWVCLKYRNTERVLAEKYWQIFEGFVQSAQSYNLNI